MEMKLGMYVCTDYLELLDPHSLHPGLRSSSRFSCVASDSAGRHSLRVKEQNRVGDAIRSDHRSARCAKTTATLINPPAPAWSGCRKGWGSPTVGQSVPGPMKPGSEPPWLRRTGGVCTYVCMYRPSSIGNYLAPCGVSWWLLIMELGISGQRERCQLPCIVCTYCGQIRGICDLSSMIPSSLSRAIGGC
jgi:hypothetical protein